MAGKLARRTTRISNGAKASNASGAQSYVKLILRDHRILDSCPCAERRRGRAIHIPWFWRRCGFHRASPPSSATAGGRAPAACHDGLSAVPSGRDAFAAPVVLYRNRRFRRVFCVTACHSAKHRVVLRVQSCGSTPRAKYPHSRFRSSKQLAGPGVYSPASSYRAKTGSSPDILRRKHPFETCDDSPLCGRCAILAWAGSVSSRTPIVFICQQCSGDWPICDISARLHGISLP